MEYLLLTVIGILLLIVSALMVKMYFLRKSAQEIVDAFRNRLTADTNALIDISSHDTNMRKLAVEINIQLRLLRKERHRYQQGDLELKEAVTNISHDLRTPLTAISGYLELLEREEKSATVARYLSRIENRADALKSLTEELFRYSVITSAQDLKPERLDMVRALEDSLLSFYGVMCEKGIKPDIHVPEAPVFRELDAVALNRIFSNIISNALKYTSGDFSVSMEQDGSITFSNTAKELNPVTVGRLFDRFYTIEVGRNSTGLGLSIAKLLTERMGGSIGAEYRESKLYIHTYFLSVELRIILTGQLCEIFKITNDYPIIPLTLAVLSLKGTIVKAVQVQPSLGCPPCRSKDIQREKEKALGTSGNA